MGMTETKAPGDSRIFSAVLLGHYQVGYKADGRRARDGDDDSDVEVQEEKARVYIAAPTQDAAEIFLISVGLYSVMDGAYADIQPVKAKMPGRNVDFIVDAGGKLMTSARTLSEYQSQWRALERQYRVFGRSTVDDDPIPVLNPGDASGRTFQVMFQTPDQLWQRCIVEAVSAEDALAAFDDQPMSYPIRLNRLDGRSVRYATAIEKGEPVPGMKDVVANVKMWITADGQLKPDGAVGYLTPLMIGGKHPWYVHVVNVTECGAQYRLPNGKYLSAVEFCTPVNCGFCGSDASQDRIHVDGDQNIYCSRECVDAVHGQYVLISRLTIGKTHIAFGPVNGLADAKGRKAEMGDEFSRMVLLKPLTEMPTVPPSQRSSQDEDDEPRRKGTSPKKRRY